MLHLPSVAQWSQEIYLYVCTYIDNADRKADELVLVAAEANAVFDVVVSSSIMIMMCEHVYI